jgi:uncharacterized LabA/DUF88 family protein
MTKVDGKAYVFVDNSNLWIEGKKIAGRSLRPALPSNRLYRIDYGKLLQHVLGGRDLADVPKLYGSEPPPNDSVWKLIRSKGFDVKVFKRNIFNKEKGVDMRMGLDIGKLVLSSASPSTIIMVAGDADFLPVIDDIHAAHWTVEVWYWSNAAGELKKAVDRFESLNSVIDQIGFEQH